MVSTDAEDVVPEVKGEAHLTKGMTKRQVGNAECHDKEKMQWQCTDQKEKKTKLKQKKTTKKKKRAGSKQEHQELRQEKKEQEARNMQEMRVAAIKVEVVSKEKL